VLVDGVARKAVKAALPVLPLHMQTKYKQEDYVASSERQLNESRDDNQPLKDTVIDLHAKLNVY